jgi:hypothetical protein
MQECDIDRISADAVLKPLVHGEYAQRRKANARDSADVDWAASSGEFDATVREVAKAASSTSTSQKELTDDWLWCGEMLRGVVPFAEAELPGAVTGTIECVSCLSGDAQRSASRDGVLTRRKHDVKRLAGGCDRIDARDGRRSDARDPCSEPAISGKPPEGIAGARQRYLAPEWNDAGNIREKGRGASLLLTRDGVGDGGPDLEGSVARFALNQVTCRRIEHRELSGEHLRSSAGLPVGVDGGADTNMSALLAKGADGCGSQYDRRKNERHQQLNEGEPDASAQHVMAVVRTKDVGPRALIHLTLSVIIAKPFALGDMDHCSVRLRDASTADPAVAAEQPAAAS